MCDGCGEPTCTKHTCTCTYTPCTVDCGRRGLEVLDVCVCVCVCAQSYCNQTVLVSVEEQLFNDAVEA